MSALDPPPARSGALLAELPSRSWLRVAFRASAFVVVVALGYAVLLLGRLFLLPWAAARARFTTALFRRWARAALWALRVRVRFRGEPPAPPFLLVCNHLSYLDTMVLASHLPCVFVSKSDVRDWPVWGGLCAALGTLFIDQSRRRDIPRVGAEIEAVLASGRGVVFFPEGMSSNGATVGPFKAPLLARSARQGRPVYYGVLGFRTPPGETPAWRSVCFWGTISFGQHVASLLDLKEIEATLEIGPQPIAHPDRQVLAEQLREAVLAKLEPMTLAAPVG